MVVFEANMTGAPSACELVFLTGEEKVQVRNYV